MEIRAIVEMGSSAACIRLMRPRNKCIERTRLILGASLIESVAAPLMLVLACIDKYFDYCHLTWSDRYLFETSNTTSDNQLPSNMPTREKIMRTLSDEIKHEILRTIECIVNSPQVYHYCIGITVDSERRRRTYKYFTPSWPYFSILRSGLSQKNALTLEEWLFEELTSDRRSILYKKYRHDTRDGNHIAATGGLKKDSDREYDLYVAWGTKESYGIDD